MAEVTPAMLLSSMIWFEIGYKQAYDDQEPENTAWVAPPPTKSSLTTKADIILENLEGYIVKTSSGPVLGHVHEDTPNIRRFYDIPYGSFSESDPFQEPIPAVPWEKVHNASEHKSRCPQIDYSNKISVDINCLTLNIMTPTEATNAGVLFHIHDGSSNYGSGDPSIYGPEYIVPKGIILVLPNYRLGALGFLCLQNATIPGNAALKDLTLALKWVKHNIAAFGGNPSNIVVSGESNAGILAGYLTISPKSRDYISKVIVESGFILSPYALDRDPITTANNVFKKIKDPIAPDTSKHNKLNNFTIVHFVEAARNTKFAPCVETGNDSFIAKTPWSLLNNLKTNISYMIGSANHAGLQDALKHTEATLSELDKDFSAILPIDLKINDDNKKSEIGEKLKIMYFGDRRVELNTVDLLSFCYTDLLYLGPMIRAARPIVASGASVFFYEFAFKGDLNKEVVSPVKINGASRGDIARYIFYQDGNITDADSKETDTIEIVTELLKNFIETG
ncbi:esterase FE4-like [Battus philenor]|uniref:esterase FE4-like n=1 Tax=Battus philenor TaxID=42288 RepID=UPI0035CFB88C